MSFEFEGYDSYGNGQGWSVTNEAFPPYEDTGVIVVYTKIVFSKEYNDTMISNIDTNYLWNIIMESVSNG